MALARAAYAEGRWAETVGRLSSVPIGQLDTVHFEMMGISYLREDNFSRARHWLELAVEGEDKPESVQALIVAHLRSGNGVRALTLCETYGKRADYERMLGEVCDVEQLKKRQSGSR